VALLNDPPLLAECRRLGPILSNLGNKWSLLVVVLLGDGPRRFNEMNRSLEGISQRMLTFTLKGLERDGMLTRTKFSTVPPRVDYELTPLGHSAIKPIRVLVDWIGANFAEIEINQARFDQRKDAE